MAYGVDLPTVVRGLERVSEVPGRLQRIECGQSFGVFVDYAHTPDALETSLRTLREVTTGRLICVFGAGGDRDRAKRSLMGRAVEQNADLAVVTDDNPRHESSSRIIRDIVGGFESFAKLEVVPDRTEAIHFALSSAREGDCVLLAGKGHETYQIVGANRFEFDDRDVCRRWLRAAPATDSVFTNTRRAA